MSAKSTIKQAFKLLFVFFGFVSRCYLNSVLILSFNSRARLTVIVLVFVFVFFKVAHYIVRHFFCAQPADRRNFV